MKRFLTIFRFTGVLALAAAAQCVSAPAAAAAASASMPAIVLQPEKVSEHVYYVRGEPGAASAANKGFMSNAGFIVTGNGVVVFDALATPVLGQALLDAIARVTDQPVRRVIVSHYHADHVYGLQAMKAAGAEIWAHAKGRAYIDSDEARERMKQRRAELAPWVDERTRVVVADRWLDFPQDKAERFEMGGVRFAVIDASGAHSAEDLMLHVESDRLLFAGDLYFTGRIPFVGNADSKAWLATLERMLDVRPAKVVPGHGAASDRTVEDMQFTRDYLLHLRKTMGAAVQDLVGFEEAYAKTDWSRFEKYPAFQQANRINAYGTYLLMERESLGGK